MGATSTLVGIRTSAQVHGQECAHRAFEQQAALTPDNLAVSFERETLTYRELDRRANQLANHLRAAGVDVDSRVGICLDPSVDLVVAVLASLKAGAAYVPLDPQYPVKRLETMVRDSSPAIVIASQSSRDPVAAMTSSIVCVDRDRQVIAESSEAAPDVDVAPSNLAYVIYTSGSTGEPKGAEIEHRGLTNYLAWCLAAYPVAAGIGSPVHSSLSFDLTVTSLLSPLVAGRAAFLIAARFGAGGLVRTTSTLRNLSLIKLTPLHVEMIGRLADPDKLAGWARAFVIGGENLLASQIELLRRSAPETRIFNEYGPTETAVGCCVFEVPPGSAVRDPVIAIGTPIFNTELYVVDPGLSLVPPGAEGELCIGGFGVARGYWKRPELTAEKFVDNPFGDGRLYRTGDLVRCLPDGNLVFLGRMDDQVKIKGNRVELGEIEAVLRDHPGVREAAVVVVGSGWNARIAAAIVADGEPPSLSALRDHCAARLPRTVMVDWLSVVASLPETSNGKVDRARIARDVAAEMAARG